VKGWEKIRVGGGAHAIMLREVTSREIACNGCIEVRRGKQTVHEGQIKMDW
jgi:ribosome-associated protein YbcJ (S4-like RNA binding protein)